jgi:hypothetical protein
VQARMIHPLCVTCPAAPIDHPNWQTIRSRHGCGVPGQGGDRLRIGNVMLRPGVPIADLPSSSRAGEN